MRFNRVVKSKGVSWVKRALISLALGGLLGVSSQINAADVGSVELSASFVDGMTLPAYKSIEVSGRAPQGHTLDVKLIRNNATVTMARVTVKSDSNWHVSLNPQSPSGPYQLKVIDNKRLAVVNDIYIGPKTSKLRNPDGGIILSTLFSDDMHLQPGEEIKVSGFTEPRSSLDIKLIKNKTTHTMARVQAASDGQWQVTMPAQSAGGPFQLVVSNGSHKKVVSGIIIGQADVKERGSNPIKNEFLEPEFDDSSWPLANLSSLENLPSNQPLLVRKYVNFASAPSKAIRFNLGDNHQVKQIYINGKLLDDKSWPKKSLIINVPSSMLQSGPNLVAMISKEDWDNTRFIGTTGRFSLSINNHDLDLKSNWRVFNSPAEAL
ncbi:MAG: DUF1533 domain-containing protein [Paraglaciecola sp.]|uniref:DUF1533 domain-containing protein n=1 Tax=Paraglaciecola sp. TaxID=1920173 RepID=UPI00329A355A